MNTAEIRRLFVDYFVERGHLLVPSSSLVPFKDPSVLLTTAGMQQFMPYFMGLAEPPSTRMVSVQKCFRTSDIDKVGLTARHCTFFEMLGNFSIGDYFKEDAIRLAWDFSVDYLKLEPDLIWISYFEGDDDIKPDEEAVGLWTSVGLPRKRMVGLPRSANFWGPVGKVGPCGPCSELYYDLGRERGCEDSGCRPGCDCDRFVEFWNLVFTGYNMHENGQLTALPARNIDTGMGLERVAALKQGVPSVFLTDAFRPLIELGEELSGQSFGNDHNADVGLRVLADHSRAIAFLVADGVNPSNEGRGYVLRRIVRRAARFSRSVGIQPPVLRLFVERVVEMMGPTYPELRERRQSVFRVAQSEEERFNRTLDQGLGLVEEAMTNARSEGTNVIPGTTAFVLHDTYGFPVEVTREIVEERGFSLDSEGFDTAMEGQRKRARRGRKGGDSLQNAVVEFARATSHPTEFMGYERDSLYTVIENLAALPDGRLVLALRESPFYAEGGGQTADIGTIESDEGKAVVDDVQQHGEVQAIIARPAEGRLEAGTRVKAVFSTAYRHDVAANHTATHLLHYALRTRLGKEVTQAGSSVRADKLRFDFAYHEPLGPKRLAEIEELANRRIIEDHPVRSFTTTIDHARDLGAIALFGEKYDDFVRVVEIDDFSRELCGGTHVASTAELGILKIVSESSVGAGVRRIEAITGRSAVAYYRSRDAVLTTASELLGEANLDVLQAVTRLQAQVAQLEAEVKTFRAGSARDFAEALIRDSQRRDGVSVVAAVVEVADMDQLLSLVDRVRDHLAPAAVALGAVLNGKGALVVSTSQGVLAVDAGVVAGEAARSFGGGGGGNPNLGRAGGLDPSALLDSVDMAKRMLWEGL
ncbi:MAG: alanine--tRNA ligase [Acidobacteria bacterium RBG_16_64_8]|nr:MAG: alanine--tRNA ligase [Acidobacteria bacterium RBG_16_64_8]